MTVSIAPPPLPVNIIVEKLVHRSKNSADGWDKKFPFTRVSGELEFLSSNGSEKDKKQKMGIKK